MDRQVAHSPRHHGWPEEASKRPAAAHPHMARKTDLIEGEGGHLPHPSLLQPSEQEEEEDELKNTLDLVEKIQCFAPGYQHPAETPHGQTTYSTGTTIYNSSTAP